MKTESDVTKMVEEIAMQAKENQEEFIFETIRPYCENILQIKINKEELKQILLNGMQKTGHWIAVVDRWGDVVTTVNGYRCDKCNAFNSDKDNFCPNCGADMRGDSE